MYGLGFTSAADTGSGGNVIQSFIADVPVIGPIINSIANSLHIGTGRNEADRITPTQNEFGDFLAQVSAYIPRATSVQALQQLAANLDTAWNAFQKFVNDTHAFPDGRASRQAIATLGPLVDGFKQGIMRRLGELGGGTMSMQPVQYGPIQSLQVPTFGAPGIPQSGTLPYYPPYQYSAPSLFGNSSLMPALIAGGLAYLFFNRSR